MTKSNRLGTALAAVSLIAITAACTTPASKVGSASFGGPVNSGELGLATKAQLALAANDIESAISLAERAVERSPQDAGFRALLGNCYLAAGRFASAEAAYRDSLSIYSAQPQVVLKLALVQIALGKSDEAKLLLAESQGLVDPSDAGLALALAGDPQAAVALLEPVARQVGADARTRQNLALAYAFAGNWEQAKVVAAQDVPADQLDARLQQWMTLSNPARASDQVAALIGIQPAATDAGQPVRLALNKVEGAREASVEPVVQPYVEPAASVELSSSATVELAPAAPAPVAVPPVVLASAPAPDTVTRADIQTASLREARPALSPAAARLSDPLPTLRKASAPRPATGKSKSVVQLGAYSSRERVAAAWAKVSGKHGSLKNYVPVTARFTGAHGTVYRLSVKGFDNSKEAAGYCASLKRNGRDCFVRAASGDAPVQFASR
jgi:D-alanyl-D-alanine carboxypeptidase